MFSAERGVGGARDDARGQGRLDHRQLPWDRRCDRQAVRREWGEGGHARARPESHLGVRSEIERAGGRALEVSADLTNYAAVEEARVTIEEDVAGGAVMVR